MVVVVLVVVMGEEEGGGAGAEKLVVYGTEVLRTSRPRLAPRALLHDDESGG